MSATAARVVEPGNDVFGIPHGGYLAALAADAVLEVSGEPDVFTITVHYLRKAAVGALDVEARRLGGSRRFGTWSATASQDEKVVLAVMASVGDRSRTGGPSWDADPAWDVDDAQLVASASPGEGDEGGFAAPAIAQRHGLQLDVATAGFVTGRTGDQAQIRAVMATEQPTVLDAIVACDIAPPAVWNTLGMQGWVPTLELTAHVRGVPAPGPLRVRATTRHVTDGILEEDAEVWDSTDRLVVQSRQLAMWSEGASG